ncbi:MAG: 6-phosphofructokinase [Sphingobacteriales bacterium]|jgi:6-phosphofructokinase 1|nr:MAG: 6-phosphofructokinase [Sphingobacteriales bacterium]
MKTEIKKIGVFTSGGDAPGMNAAIRAVVRTALYHKVEVVGIMKGFEGMISGEFMDMDMHSVANTIHRGGTILKTSRCPEFKTPEGRKKAYDNLKAAHIDALIAIGGDGTFVGVDIFGKEYKMPIMGIPGTIDNDLYGTDFTIGYDTAINTVVNAVDKIRDTAESHDRLFIVEVMGRDNGLIALRSAIGVGADSVLIPDSKRDFDFLIKRLEMGRRYKSSKIIMVGEDEEDGGFGMRIGEMVREKFPNYDTRVSVLGHLQRGGKPTCMDRVLASRLGVSSVEQLLKGRKGEMLGLVHGNVAYTPFAAAVKHIEDINDSMLKIVEILSL